MKTKTKTNTIVYVIGFESGRQMYGPFKYASDAAKWASERWDLNQASWIILPVRAGIPLPSLHTSLRAASGSSRRK